MRYLLLTSVAAALLPLALPAPAAADPADARPAAAARPAPGRDAATDPDRRICLNVRLSSSHLPRRVCRTARQWQLLQAADDDDR